MALFVTAWFVLTMYAPVLGVSSYSSQWQTIMDSLTAQGYFNQNNSVAKHFLLPSRSFDFLCSTQQRSTNLPTSVDELRPHDIAVVAAIGDSITAGIGVGAENIVEVVIENRGESWSIGGDLSLQEGVLTIPNILKKFNPNITGFSSGSDGLITEADPWLNVAKSGAIAQGLPAQADELVHKMSHDHRIDFQKDWKLVTLFVGGNDLCSYCDNRILHSPSSYMNYIRVTLDILHASVPRAFVNLVVMFDITPLPDISEGPVCFISQRAVCRCAVVEESRSELREVQLGYYRELLALVDSMRYDTRNDFTVVVQPHFRDLQPPILSGTGDYDTSFFSADCFHPSRKGHQGMALTLWNTMLTPEHEKIFNYPLESDPHIKCPTQVHPYLFTRKSKSVKRRSVIETNQMSLSSEEQSTPIERVNSEPF